MFDISVVEILKKHGKWIDSSQFAKLVSEKRNVSERQAYNLIKKAYKNREISKYTLPDRKVVYGLPEFGILKYDEKPVEKTLNFTEAFVFDCFRELKEINNLALKEPREAHAKLSFLINRLPKPLKEKIEPVRKKHLYQLYLTDSKSKEYDIQCLMSIQDLTDIISTLLHEYFQKSQIL